MVFVLTAQLTLLLQFRTPHLAQLAPTVLTVTGLTEIAPYAMQVLNHQVPTALLALEIHSQQDQLTKVVKPAQSTTVIPA